MIPYGIFSKMCPEKLYQLTFGNAFQGVLNQFINSLMPLRGELFGGPIGQYSV